MTEETNTTELTEKIIPNSESQIMAEAIVHHQTIGEILKSKREERGLSLKVISQQTKIHIGLLEHLENNELTKLPSKTYVRGFVKSAAKILGINQQIALDALESTYNRDKKVVKKETPTSIEMRNEAARNTLSAIASTPLETVKSVTAFSSMFIAKGAVVLVIAGVILFNVKNLIDKSAEEKLKLPKVLSTISQRSKPTPRAVAPKAAPKVEVDPAKVAPITVNLIPDKKDGSAKNEVTINEVSLKTISLGEKQFTEDNSLDADKLNDIFPDRYRVQATKGVENVFINATEGDSWITYKVDDKDIKKYVLRQGRTVFMRGEKIRLFIGNTKSIKVFYNNKLINLNAKNGTKNLVFPEELKTKFMSPLFVFQKDGSVLTSDDYLKKNQVAVPASSAPGTQVTPANTKTPAPVSKVTPSVPVKKI